MLGYGIVLITHSAARVEKTADGSEVEIISPDLPRRAAEICNGIVDIIGYIGNEYDKNTSVGSTQEKLLHYLLVQDLNILLLRLNLVINSL